MSSRRRLLIGLGFVGGLAVVAVLPGEYASMEVLVHHETGLRAEIADHPFQTS
jgi:hypothetical protein